VLLIVLLLLYKRTGIIVGSICGAITFVMSILFAMYIVRRRCADPVVMEEPSAVINNNFSIGSDDDEDVDDIDWLVSCCLLNK
jgi:hypothetical protein